MMNRLLPGICTSNFEYSESRKASPAMRLSVVQFKIRK